MWWYSTSIDSKQRGIEVPTSVSLFGYGDFTTSRLLNIPLSTISIPVAEMGKAAAEMIAKIIEGKKFEQKLMLDVKLEERCSVIKIWFAIYSVDRV